LIFRFFDFSIKKKQTNKQTNKQNSHVVEEEEAEALYHKKTIKKT